MVVATHAATWGESGLSKVRSGTRALLHGVALLCGRLPLCGTFGSVLGKTRLELCRSLHLALLLCVGLSLAWRRVASQSSVVGLLLEELVQDALSVRVEELLWDATHPEDFGVDVLAAFDGVLDNGEGCLVNLLQVDCKTARGVKPAVTMVALEVLGLLVLCKDTIIVEVALAVIAPRARDDLLDVGLVALFLVHHGCGVCDLM